MMAIPQIPKNEENFLKKKPARDAKAKRTAYPVRLHPELYEWLADYALANDRTVADVLRTAVREFREKHDAPPA
jgi:hypothetical protein